MSSIVGIGGASGQSLMGGGGFVLKSVRGVTAKCYTSYSFTVQNEGDFCFMVNEPAYDNVFYNTINKIDGVSVGFATNKSIIFGKSVELTVGANSTTYSIYEYGPAE